MPRMIRRSRRDLRLPELPKKSRKKSLLLFTEPSLQQEAQRLRQLRLHQPQLQNLLPKSQSNRLNQKLIKLHLKKQELSQRVQSRALGKRKLRDQNKPNQQSRHLLRSMKRRKLLLKLNNLSRQKQLSSQ